MVFRHQVNEKETILKKGVFTSCKKNDSCPAWSFKSKEVKHDKIKKNIEYKHAVLNIYDFPVFYFPKFFHPDPTVKRRSGLLRPELRGSKILGSSLNLPYFHVISDNKDLTLNSTLFKKDMYMFQNEYRQVDKNSN
jgi:LPS-assembly protein